MSEHNYVAKPLDWRSVLQWTMVYTANLPVPVLMSLVAITNTALFGLISGIALLYFIGAMLCGFRFRLGKLLVVGGIGTAISQLFPILHLAAGGAAIGAWQDATSIRMDDTQSDWTPEMSEAVWPQRNLGAFLIVLMTAQPFWILAILIGISVQSWYKRRARQLAEYEDAEDEDDE